MKNNYLLLCIVFLFTFSVFGQGVTCDRAEPFCANNNALVFPNTSGSGSAEIGPNYGCLNTQPNPAWYYLQIGQAGDLNIQISQNTQQDFTGAGLDVDFICYGPFTSTSNCSNLTAANTVSCSYSPSAIENFTINNAVVGDIYILLITNYDNLPGFISLQQTNSSSPGAGSTDCSIVNTVNYCDGEVATLDGTLASAVSYSWFRNGVPLAETGPILNNVVAPSAVYVVQKFNSTGGLIEEETFNVVFNSVPLVNPVTDYLLCDDATADGFTQFDLSTKDAEGIGAQTNVSVSYHSSQADADANANPLPNLYTNVSNPETIFIRIENDNNTDCYTTSSFELSVTTGLTANQPPDINTCDDISNDGIETFDLTSQDATVLGGQTGVTVTYHLSQADADGDINPLMSPYANVSSPQTIFVRVEDNINTACYETTSFNLVVSNLPTANQPPNIETCDDSSNDGVEQFNLDSQTATVLGTQLPTDYTVTYHESQNDADTDSNALTSPYLNISSPQTIFVRIENNNNVNCFDTTTFSITVNPAPTATQPPDYNICDDSSNDGFEIFDLTSQSGTILGAQVGVTLTFYESQVDADSGNNPILTPANYLNLTNPQTIYTRVEDNVTGCFTSLTSFDLIVNPFPALTIPTALEVCDDNIPDGFTTIDLTLKNSEISGGNANYSISYYLTQADADTSSNALAIPYANISNPQTIYARGEDINTGCHATVALDLIVEQAPVANTPPAMEFCDLDNDGFGEFILSNSDLIITGGDPTLNVTYHETQADAQNNVNSLGSPYSNIVAYNQTVFVRVVSPTVATDCATFVEMDLVVYDSPVIIDPITSLEVCDDNTNGFAQFDLTSKDSEILGAQLPSDFNLTYHVTQADADSGNNPIINPGNYTNLSNPQTVYVRLEHAVNGCVNTGEFELIVNPLPVVVTPTPLELCDDDFYAAADGIQTFDLTSKDSEITSGEGSLLVNYYESNADAQADSNVITNSSAYQNNTNPQTVYVRITDVDTGCFSFTTLTIRVLPNPTPQTPLPIVLCDDINPGDGVEVFDLTIREADIINGELGVSATYYETQADADSGTNQIPDPTMYTSLSNSQIIYVRVTNDISGCYTIVELELEVNPVPDVIAVTNLIECELNTDGFYDFDLESKTAEILNGQDPTIFNVSYHATQIDAQTGTNALISPYTNLTNPQQIFVNITDTSTGCDISTVSFLIEVQEDVVANMPLNDYVICDNVGDNDGFGQFDLSTQDAEILGGQNPMGYTVSYYNSLTDAEAGVNALATTYENQTNPQVIYARVDNNSTICYQTTTLNLRVELLPIFSIDDNYILCVDSPEGVVTLVSPPVIDTGLDASEYSFEWTDNTGSVVGTDSTFTPMSQGDYTVEVTNLTTGCQNNDSTTVEQSSPPDITAEVTTLAFAEIHVIEANATGEGVYEFNLDGGPWQESGTFTDVSAGEHVITARDVNGCGESSTTVIIMDYPLYFTPNGDGYHDTWNIIGISNQLDAEIYIFDRYGKLLKQLSPTSLGWDGTFNGEALPSSDYWFIVNYREPSDDTKKEFKAHFTLKR